MKIRTGRYHSQWGFGIYFTHFNNVYNSIVLDLIFFYIELIIKDYDDEYVEDETNK